MPRERAFPGRVGTPPRARRRACSSPASCVTTSKRFAAAASSSALASAASTPSFSRSGTPARSKAGSNEASFRSSWARVRGPDAAPSCRPPADAPSTTPPRALSNPSARWSTSRKRVLRGRRRRRLRSVHSERAGRVMEPRNGTYRGCRRCEKGGRQHRSAKSRATPEWLGNADPPGSESRACTGGRRKEPGRSRRLRGAKPRNCRAERKRAE